MLIVALLGSAVLVGIVGSVMALDAVLSENEIGEDTTPPVRPSFVVRLRERVLLRWDITRRLQ